MRILKVFLIVVFYFASIGWFLQGNVAKKNKEATKLYKKGNIDGALSKWREAQIKSPENKKLHYNIGGALHEQQSYEEAYKEYEKAEISENAEFQSKIYYNMGNTNYRIGKLEDAIEDYEKSLDLNPDDEDAKFNIEFIKKKMEEMEKQQQEEGEEKEEEEEKEEGQEQQQQEGEEKEEESQGSQSQEEGEEEEQSEGTKAKEDKEESKEGEMSEEDAVRLLEAIKDDEKELQEKLRVQQLEGRYKVDKDW
ncbi:MAG: tetratricopeptide repeat protein [Candidatus Omnitrophota bacterium]|jgi:tetratricopeptide (TPR) repeat protein|nr:tetratricopeptide repeat protein [Candidatus Omnitrophota bacterium]